MLLLAAAPPLLLGAALPLLLPTPSAFDPVPSDLLLRKLLVVWFLLLWFVAGDGGGRYVLELSILRFTGFIIRFAIDFCACVWILVLCAKPP